MNFIWLRTWQIGVKSLLLHPLRSLLTVLGIFIGVASVIWLLAIGEGISRKAQEQIEGLGANNIIVRSHQAAAGDHGQLRRTDSLRPRRGPISPGTDGPLHDRLARCRSARSAAVSATRQQDRRRPARRLHARVRRGDASWRWTAVTSLPTPKSQNKENVCVLAARRRRAAVPLREPAWRSDPRRGVLLHGRGRDEVPQSDRRHRRLAGGPGLRRRRLHPVQHAADPHRRLRGHRRQRLRSRARSSSSARSRCGSSDVRPGDGNCRPGARHAGPLRTSRKTTPSSCRWSCWSRPAPRG